MREGWEIKKLGEIGTIVGGSTPKTNIPEYWGEGYPWITPAELNGSKYVNATERTITEEALKHTNLTLLPVGSVLLSSRAPIGKVAITAIPLYCNQGFKNIVCGPGINNEYVYWFLIHRKEYLISLGRGATFKEISKHIVEQVPILVPPVQEQEKIVAELDCLTGIIEKKKQQLKELDNLAQSIFYDMFGDPERSSFPIKTLGELSKTKLSYGSGASAIPYDGKLRYVRITDIDENGELNNDIMSPSAFDEKYLLHEGDLLFARSGATVGKTYLYRTADGDAIYAGYLIRVVPDTRYVKPKYLFSFTKTEYYRRFIGLNAQAVAQPNINAKQYGSLKVVVPPLDLQSAFAQKIEAIEKQKELIKKSIQETETLFNSRMDYWFN